MLIEILFSGDLNARPAQGLFFDGGDGYIQGFIALPIGILEYFAIPEPQSQHLPLGPHSCEFVLRGRVVKSLS